MLRASIARRIWGWRRCFVGVGWGILSLVSAFLGDSSASAQELRVEDRSGLVRLLARIDGNVTLRVTTPKPQGCETTLVALGPTSGGLFAPQGGGSPDIAPLTGLKPLQGVVVVGEGIVFHDVPPGKWLFDCAQKNYLLEVTD